MADLKPEHTAFARALVALARQHQIGSLDVTLRDSVSTINSGSDFWAWKQMRMQWSEGWHGDTSNIKLKHEAETVLTEQDAPGVSRTDGEPLSRETPLPGASSRNGGDHA